MHGIIAKCMLYNMPIVSDVKFMKNDEEILISASIKHTIIYFYYLALLIKGWYYYVVFDYQI